MLRKWRRNPSLYEALTNCVKDQKGSTRGLIGDYPFEFSAGSSFQNNNCVNDNGELCSRPGFSGWGTTEPISSTRIVEQGLLLSGLENAVGIEPSQSSIASAKRNAQLNSTSSDKISFLSGGASNIFATVKDFPQNKRSSSPILLAKAVMSRFWSNFWISVVALSCMWAVTPIRGFVILGWLYGRRREMGKWGWKLREALISFPRPRMSNRSPFSGCIRPAGHCGPVYLRMSLFWFSKVWFLVLHLFSRY